MSNFMKIRPLGTHWFHVDGWTDIHFEANSRFRNFTNVPKKRAGDISSEKKCCYQLGVV
jgi:hypothetical protein